MKKGLVFFALLSLWLSLDGSSVWAQDVGWMQKGVRVWYFGAAGTDNAEEAYLFASINGNTAQLTHHSGINHWSLPTAVTETGSILGQGPCWIHPQVLQNIKVGDNWMGIRIASMNRATYTYDTFKNTDELSSLPYLLLPIKALFDLQNQRQVVKLVYGIPYYPYYDPVWGTAYFDAETGLCLFNLRLTASNTVWFILSEINYDFATQRAFAEDNGPHTGFKSNVIKTSSTSQYVMIQSSVETRYGDTVQMWVSTSAGGRSGSYFGRDENYCFFGSVPVLKRKLMSAIPQYPPENWNEYGEYLWWWVPQEALQSSSINIFDVLMERTSTAPYTFSATGVGTGLYFSKMIFDDDGYMTDFSAKDSTIGLDIGLGTYAPQPIHLVDGLTYYKNTMGRATPAPPAPGAATLISPSGTIMTTTPTYTWNAVATATEYDLKVNDSTGNKILQWHSASEAGCASGTGTCSVTPATALAAGPGKWWIQTKNSGGTGPLSSPMSFTVLVAPTVTSFNINSGAASTANGTVTLNNTATNSPTHYMASESSDFAGASWQTYSSVPSFTLSGGKGTKTVYFKVRKISDELVSPVKSDTIEALVPTVTSFRISAGAVSTSNNAAVTLNNTATNIPTHYMASEVSDFARAIWQKYSTAPSFALSSGSGTKTVYFKVKNAFDQSAYMEDKIETLKPVVTSFKINAGAASTANSVVTLNNAATNSPTHYKAASTSEDLAGASWLPYSTAPKFTLSDGGGEKKVYFKVKNSFAESSEASDDILALGPAVTSFKINAGAASTANSVVTLNNVATNSPTHYKAASTSEDLAGASWLPYSTAPKFTLSDSGGSKWVFFKVKNSIAESSEASDDISAAGSAPVVTSFKINAGAANTANRVVTLNNVATNSPTHYKAASTLLDLETAAWLPYSTAPKFTLSEGAGTKWVFFKVKNIFGDSSLAASDDILALGPVVTSFKINAGAASTANSVVTLNNVATNSPTHYKAASTSEDLAGASWLPYSTAPKFTLSDGGGEKKVYFKVKNSFAESSEASDDILALGPAVTSFKINAGAASTANSVVTLNNVATNSPTHYKAASTLLDLDGASWLPYSTAPKFTLSDSGGSKWVFFKVKNSIAESSEASDDISAAGSAPVVTSFKINAGAANTANRVVTLNNVATNSPTHYKAASTLLDLETAAWLPYSTAPKFTLSEGAGTKWLYFKVKNIFGESLEAHDDITGLKPTVTLKINAGAASTANSVVTLNNVATNSPTDYMASEDENFLGAGWQPYATAPKFTLSDGSDEKKVYFKVKNSFAESSPASNDTILAAGPPPVVTSFKINAGSSSTAAELVTLNNTASNSPTHCMVSEDPNFVGASWQVYSTVPKLTLSSGIGTKTIYFKVKNAFDESAVVSDTIYKM